MKIKMSTAIAIAGLCVGASMSANATIRIFEGSTTGTAGQVISAQATFETLAGNQLQITLVNTATTDAHTTADALTTFLFNGIGTLAPASATVPSGQTEWLYTGASTVLGSDLDVGAGWHYNPSYSTSVSPDGTASVIGTSGLGLGGNKDNFAGGTFADGFADYALVPLGFRTEGGSYDGFDQSQQSPVYENTTVFVLDNYTGNLSEIDWVGFQYGTAWGGTSGGDSLIPVPEPTTMIAGALLLLPFGASTIRILRRKK